MLRKISISQIFHKYYKVINAVILTSDIFYFLFPACFGLLIVIYVFPCVPVLFL